jgi:hypothetical protein
MSIANNCKFVNKYNKKMAKKGELSGFGSEFRKICCQFSLHGDAKFTEDTEFNGEEDDFCTKI